MKRILILSSIAIVFFGCNKTKKTVSQVITGDQIEKEQFTQPKQEPSKATKIINEAIAAHGGVLYDTAEYSFVFRKKEYRFTNTNDGYTYSVKNPNKKTHDFIVNSTFKRYSNEELVELSQKNKNKYAEALNSVIYFATLPHKLKDAAVHKKFIETTTIKGSRYDVIEVTFSQEGGGKDYDDEFHYWIHQDTKKIDYLAYNYQVNGGGVRFRSAYNRRVVDGITFQDYINWKASVGTPLKELPALYEQGKLKELSRIVTEQVTNLKK